MDYQNQLIAYYQGLMSSYSYVVNKQILFYFCLGCIPIIGIINLLVKLSSIKKNLELANEFGKNITFFIDRSQLSEKDLNIAYVWLSMNVDKMQNILGPIGYTGYKPAFSNTVINNYLILINTISKLSSNQESTEDVRFSQNAILRYIGIQQETSIDTCKHLMNPFYWIFEGIRVLLALPILLLKTFGFFNNIDYYGFLDNFVIRFFSFLITIIGLFASIIQILQGWDFVISLFSSFL